MLLRFDPFRELDRHFDWAIGRQPTLPMDAYRDGDRYFVHFDLPGVDPDSIDVTVDKDVLTVKAERQWSRESTDGPVVARERAHGTFSRSLYLGDSLDADHVEADYVDGVLTLTIPVAESAKPRKIAVGNGQSDPQPEAIETTSRAA